MICISKETDGGNTLLTQDPVIGGIPVDKSSGNNGPCFDIVVFLGDDWRAKHVNILYETKGAASSELL